MKESKYGYLVEPIRELLYIQILTRLLAGLPQNGDGVFFGITL